MAKQLKHEDWVAFQEAHDNMSYPDYTTLAAYLGITKGTLKRKINKYNKMREEDPTLKALIDREDLHNQMVQKTHQWPETDYSKIKYGKGTYVITGAQIGARVPDKVIAAFKNRAAYAADGKVLVPVIQYGVIHKTNKASGLRELTTFLSDKITKDPALTVIYPDTESIRLNDNCELDTTRIRPTMVNPLAGLKPSPDSATKIFAAPTLRQDVIATRYGDIPKIHMTTGACTHPFYKDERAGRIAKDAHCYAAIIVEVVNNKIFHFRQLLANKEGEFYDIVKEKGPTAKLGLTVKKFTSKGVFDAPNAVSAVVLGDWHEGETDPTVRKIVTGKNGVLAVLKPLYTVIHDFFNGHEISHHDASLSITMARKAIEGGLSLQNGLDALTKEVRHFLASIEGKLVINRSNHDEVVDRWLEEWHRAKDDHINKRIFHQLSLLKIDAEDSKKSAIALYLATVLTKKELARIDFLDRFHKDFVLHGIQLGMHGDKGASGSRASLAQMNNLGIRIIFGHTHTPGIFGNAWSVGTSTKLQLSYNSGPSKWLHTFAVVYKNGQRQLVNIIEGKWHG